jgi:hypothetical protein
MITALVAALVMHPGGVPSALAKVGGDGSVHLRVRFDVLSYVLDQTPAETSESSLRKLVALPSNELDERLEEAEGRFKKTLVFSASGARVQVASVEFPSASIVQETVKNHAHLPALMPVTATAKLPAGSTNFSLRFPDVMDTVILTIERHGHEPHSEKVKSGRSSKAVAVKVKG